MENKNDIKKYYLKKLAYGLFPNITLKQGTREFNSSAVFTFFVSNQFVWARSRYYFNTQRFVVETTRLKKPFWVEKLVEFRVQGVKNLSDNISHLISSKQNGSRLIIKEDQIVETR